MNRRAAVIGAASLGAGLLLFRFAHGELRGWFGDVLVIVFLVSLLAAAGIGRPWQRIVGIGAVSIGTELVQGLRLVGPESHWVLHLTVGSTFDPWDLLAYAVGLVAAAGAERWWGAAPPGQGRG